jgi:hypothetical protein
MIPDGATFSESHSGTTSLELDHGRAEFAGVGDHQAENPTEEPLATRSA